MDTQIDHKAVEAKRYRSWEQSGVFKPPVSNSVGAGGSPAGSQKPPLCIMMPPPNVTGSLHMGHALNLTLQDILARYGRMQGKAVLWQPGMDHAGIATQMVVERELAKEGLQRKELGREAFVKKVWDWKHEASATILNQQRRLGITPDWDRGRFTMDPDMSKTVRDVFVRLHTEGLVYQDEKLVNWDPKFQTAISDLEVESETRKGHFWYFRYPLVENPTQHIVIATTRPETLFGDVAVAVNPEDPRYQSLIGKHVQLPLTQRTIPIIADMHSDPEKGTGAVKITPAHDFNDFEVGLRHDLPRITIMDETAHMDGPDLPEGYQGLSREKARVKVVHDMEAGGFLEKIDEMDVTFPIAQRSGVVVEPRLTKQWFINMAPLAEKALKVVADGETAFLPENWTKVYNDWLTNIQPWCVSRQLWWGHQLPVWYGPDDTPFVGKTIEDAQRQADAHYKKTVSLRQDPDVMDTWFSSALWPFATLGWPDKTPDFEQFYPTATLITGFDIIFFWVARMIMMGQHLTGKAPFKTVYMHALVLDDKGQKMSKSKGNVVDPLSLLDTYGADNLRFALGVQATPGRDIRFSVTQVESARHFSTKIWNCARFYLRIRGEVILPIAPVAPAHFLNQWILSECATLIQTVTRHMEAFRYDLALQEIYQFAWSRLCDWYLELTKPVFEGDNNAHINECQHVLGYVFQQVLKLLHPCMPFISEEVWGHLFGEAVLDHAPWPVAIAAGAVPPAATDLMTLISAIRTARGEVGASPREKAVLYVVGETTHLIPLLPYLSQMARVSELRQVTEADLQQAATLQMSVQGVTYAIPLAGLIDIAAEAVRLEKVIEKSAKEIDGLARKLDNARFVANAPPEIITKNRARLAMEQQTLDQAQKALSQLR